MRAFLQSLRSDLLDRRFLPVLVLLGLALAAALVFAVFGGGSSPSSTPPVAGASSGLTGPAGAVAITQAPVANEAVAETTSGAHHHHGAPRNPFTPLPSKQAKASSTSAPHAAGSSGSRASGSGNPTSSPRGGTAPAGTIKPIAPAKRVIIHFHTTVQFGVVPTVTEGSPPQPAQLQTYRDMPIDQPLPGKENPQLVYLGVVLRTGNEAVFGLTGEAILHGSATCKPSPTQCQGIELGVGQTETLEVVGPTGQPVTYELKLVSISKSSSSASAAKVHAASAASAKAGRVLLRRAGLSALPGLRYSTETSFVRSGK